jgi:zinc protease
MAMVATFQKDGPPPEVVDKIKATQKQERETALKQNDFWLGELFGSYRFGDDPAHILTDGKLVDGLTVASIRAAAKRYFGNDHVLGVLRPADVKKP